MQHQDLAKKLGIRKQNINLWIKGKQDISKKYLPELSETFGIGESYFQKELDDVDKLVVQKQKLSRELRDINDIQFEISKAKVVSDFRDIINTITHDFDVQMYEKSNKLFEAYGDKQLIKDTIDALSHYFDVLPDWVAEPDSDNFVQEFLELVDKYYKDGHLRG